MARLISLLSLLIISYTTAAQSITVNPNPVNFGTVFTNDSDTINIVITNNTAHPQMIKDVDIYKSGFTLLDTFFNMAANGTDTIRLIFHPRHNIKYNTELVLYTELTEGHIAVDVQGTGKYRDSYYDLTQNLSEESLKLALKNIISTGYVSLGYNQARDRMFMEIDNKRVNGEGAAVNTLECVYTGRIITGYSSRSIAQSSPYNFNTEHTFPQSTFNQDEPMRSDLFHLFPTDINSNSVRANYPFRYVTNPVWQEGGSKSSGSTFEPRDEQKGPTARAMLYFLIRYGNPTNYVNATDEAVLKEWHSLFLPDSVEHRRNDAIHTYQKNRNPFIDHPEFAERINSFISTSSAPVINTIVVTEDTIIAPLLSVGDTFKYELIVVNTGNVIANLANAAVTGQGYINSIDTAVYPGEAGRIELHVVPVTVGSLNEFLTFNHSTTSYSILVKGEAFPTTITDPFLSGVKIYPNPVKDHLKIEVTESTDIFLTDITGRVLISKKVYSYELLDVSDLTSGAYILIVKQKDHLIQQKILKF